MAMVADMAMANHLSGAMAMAVEMVVAVDGALVGEIFLTEAAVAMAMEMALAAKIVQVKHERFPSRYR